MLRKIIQFMVHSSWFRAKELFLCGLCAALLIFSFPRFNICFFSWFAFVPLFFATRDKSSRIAFLLFYFTGILFWFGIIYWLVHVTLAGLIVLVLYLALYFGIFGLGVSTINHQPSTINHLFIPSLWVLLEYIRSHLFTGFPWALLGYAQYLNLPIIQIADITGAWGVSFLVMMVNVAIYIAVSGKLSAISKKQKYLLPILALFVTLTYGYFKIYSLKLKMLSNLPLKISVIQGNIPQELKWDIRAEDFIMGRYLGLTSEAAKDKLDLIIWPEAALPSVLEEEPVFFENVKRFVKEINIPLLLGALTSRNNLYYNSTLLISGDGKLLNRYDKLHLVPFGEYIPLRKILGFLETVVPIGDFSPGKEYTVFSIPTKFSVLICFEDLFPQISREFTKKGANFLVNITNDAWFGKTSSPYQHLQASVFRAVENRLCLVRAANTGVSGFIGPAGKIISLVQDKSGRNIFVSGYKTQEIFIARCPLSFYTRFGDVFIVICLVFILYGIMQLLKKSV